MSYVDKLKKLREDVAILTAGERHVPDFDPWLRQYSPGWSWDWPHVVYMRHYLDRVTAGDIDRLMFFLPPRHGKTSLVTVRYTAWRLEKNPSTRVIIGSYNQSLSEKVSRQVRRMVGERVPLNDERKAAEEWLTLADGGLRAAGVGSGVTGYGGDLIVIDDPVKSREEAKSAAYRERCWDWFTNDIWTRREPGAALILIMTRWDPDDLAGRILASSEASKWTVVSLPALAEENDALGREPGQALCPERFDEESLEESKLTLGNDFEALYQQRPFAREGALFKRSWFSIIDVLPSKCKYVRFWDKAGTSGAGDYTAGVLMARDSDGRFYVVDVVHGQWSAYERESVIKQTADQDKLRYKDVKIWLEQEPGSGGKESAEATVRNLAGYSVHAERSTGDKVTRADPFAAQCESGNVYLVRGKWNSSYIDELTAFPYGRHDDQVDGSSGSFSKLIKKAPSWASLDGLGHIDGYESRWGDVADRSGVGVPDKPWIRKEQRASRW